MKVRTGLGALLAALLLPSTALATKVCAKGATTPGIDVSKWQGAINWTKVKASGQKFVIARISDGTYLDTQFDSYWPAMKKAGFVVGAYQFFEPAQDVIKQADILLAKMGPMEPGMLPPTLDVEAAGGKTPAQVEAAVAQWIAYVQPKIGVAPMIYTGAWFWDPQVASSAQSGLPLWTSNYCTNCCASVPAAWKEWAIWQFNDKGVVGGISGDCDMDLWNGDLASLNVHAGGDAPSTCTTVYDSTDSAKAISDGKAYAGTACAVGDTDYFALTTCGPFTSTAVANASSFDCACAILDASGKELSLGGSEGYVRDDAYNGDSGCACSIAKGNGSYFLKVFGSAAGAYTLTKSAPIGCTGPGPDAGSTDVAADVASAEDGGAQPSDAKTFADVPDRPDTSSAEPDLSSDVAAELQGTLPDAGANIATAPAAGAPSSSCSASTGANVGTWGLCLGLCLLWIARRRRVS